MVDGGKGKVMKESKYHYDYNSLHTIGAAVVQWLSSWLGEHEVRGSIPGLVDTISEIDYLLIPSRDMTEISLKRR